MAVAVLKQGSFKILALALVAGAILCCTRSAENIDEANLIVGNVLRLDVPSPFTSLDPTTEESGSILVFPFLYDSLFSLNEQGEFVPELAASSSYDPERFTWTIDLKKGPKFHNGKPIEASDVVYSLRESLEKLRPEIFDSIERMASSTGSSLQITLKHDDPKLLSKIYFIEIIPESTGGSGDSYSHPIGSGPFRFEYRNGEKEVHLVANQDYYKGRPSFDRVMLTYEADSETSWARLINGSTDGAFGIHPVDYEMLDEHRDSFAFTSSLHALYTILLFNTHDPALSDEKVRLALSLAVDKEAIIRNVLKGYGEISTGPLALNSPYHNKGLKPVPYEPQRAVRLLEQAGWAYDEQGRYLQKDGTPFELTLLYPEKERSLRGVAEWLQLYLNDAGIKVRLASLPIDALMRRYVGSTDFQAVLTEMDGAATNPGALQDEWLARGSDRSGAVGLENAALARLLTEAAGERDSERRTELYGQAEALIASLQPGIFLFQRQNLDVLSKRIEFPHRFSLTLPDIYRLRSACVRVRPASGK